MDRQGKTVYDRIMSGRRYTRQKKEAGLFMKEGLHEAAHTSVAAAGACGDWCGKCPHFPEECSGCRAKSDTCGFLKCLAARGLEHCGECPRFPCEDLASFVPDDRLPKGFHIESLRYRTENSLEKWLQRFPQEWSHLVK